MYKCHICGAPLDHPGRCPECGEPPVRDWMDDKMLKGEKGDTMTNKEFCELCFLRNEYCAERVIFPPEDGEILETLEFTVTYETKSEKGKISGSADARSVTINGEKRYCCHPFPTLENILRMVKDFKEPNEDKGDEE